MERIGTGKGVAALLNGRAKRVNGRVVRALERALPDALVLVSEDFEQARRHVRCILEEKPLAVLSGGGDGAVVRLINLLREEGGGAPLPTVGVLKLGTGNGWARVTGALDYYKLLRALPMLPRSLPVQRFDLVEVEDQLCHFAGVGWDARILNDYLRNLDKRSSQLIGSGIASWFHKGVPGYLYSVLRITIPEEFGLLRAQGQARMTLENRGNAAYSLDPAGTPLSLRHPSGEGPAHLLYDGPISIGAVGSTPEWGFGFRAFPFARIKPGFINIRAYDQPVFEAVRNAVKLWRGNFPLAGMRDFFVTGASMQFSRPMPFQIGGDGVGLREEVEFRVARETVPVVDWTAALATAAP